MNGGTARNPGSGGAGLRHRALPRAVRQLIVQAAVAALWIASWRLGRIQEYAPHASLWFPPAGLAFASFVVLGARAAPAIGLAALLVTLDLGSVYGEAYPRWSLLAAGVLFALGHGLAYALGAAAFRRWGRDRPIPAVVIAFLLVAPLSALLAALGGGGALAVAGVISGPELRTILIPWWIGDFGGVVALTPVFALAIERVAAALDLPVPGFSAAAARLAPAAGGRPSLLVKVAACLVPLAGSFALVVVGGPAILSPSFLAFFAIVPLMWIAYTEGALRTFWVVAALSALIAGAGALLGPGDHTTAYQFAMIVLAGSAYFGLAVPALYLDNQALRRLANTDALTGAASRPAFLEGAEREVERARRFRTPLSLIVLDVDRFKELNDGHGHLFGDAVLAEVSLRLVATLRGSDLLGRLGGDEFGVLLPMADLAAARETAGRLAEALRETPVRRGSVEARVTASFGVAELAPGAERFEGALERADRALYEAKRAGRDRVAVAQAPPAPPPAPAGV